MNIAFYAPMKPPTSARPSGDRLIARLLIKALENAGHQVELASRFRSYDKTGDDLRQRRIMHIGSQLSDRLTRHYQSLPDHQRPQIWMTYHVYHKAPDVLGPIVSRVLNIPYMLIEASNASKQKNGPWALGYKQSTAAIRAADCIIGLSRVDKQGVMGLLSDPSRYVDLAPFIDVANFPESDDKLLTTAPVKLLTVAMMRSGDKLQSYQILAKALGEITHLNWQLDIAGGGDAERDVKNLMAPFSNRVRFLGVVPAAEMMAVYQSAEVFVWPAVKETPGMCFIEAAAAGLPAIGADAYGVPDVIDHNQTGFLCRPNDVDDMVCALTNLINDLNLRHQMGQAARQKAIKIHSLDAASRSLARIISELV